MRLLVTDVPAYVADLVALVERCGVEVLGAGPIEVVRTSAGAIAFAIAGRLPGGGTALPSTVEVREAYEPVDADTLERAAYAFELIDRERGFRRAFHQHDPEWFARTHLVVVHEHCERPIGVAPCAHLEGTPIRDGFAGIMALLDGWIMGPPDCSTLRCLG